MSINVVQESLDGDDAEKLPDDVQLTDDVAASAAMRVGTDTADGSSVSRGGGGYKTCFWLQRKLDQQHALGYQGFWIKNLNFFLIKKLNFRVWIDWTTNW